MHTKNNMDETKLKNLIKKFDSSKQDTVVSDLSFILQELAKQSKQKWIVK